MLWVREGLAVAIFPESMRCFCEGLHIETLAEPALETKILLIWKKGKQPDESGAEVSGYMHEINCVSCGAAGCNFAGIAEKPVGKSLRLAFL